jgi:hypothetical protein
MKVAAASPRRSQEKERLHSSFSLSRINRVTHDQKPV